MTKRIMALLMAASMAVSCALLVSCGDSTTKAPGKNTPTQAESKTPSATPTETPTSNASKTPATSGSTTPASGSETPATPSDDTTPTSGSETPVSETMPDKATRLAKPDEFVNWLNKNAEASAKEYETSLYGPTAATGGFETWGSHFHQCILFPTVIAPVATGVGTEDYKYSFEVYYKVYDAEGSYKAVPVNVWSIYEGQGWDNYILRVQTYSCGINDLVAKSADEPNFYDYIFCAYETNEEGEETLICWFDLLLEISSEYENALNQALADDAVVK